MIGTDINCSGSYGIQCGDEILNDSCLDLHDIFDISQDSLPIDPSKRIFSKEKTGYYLTVRNGELVVAACNPGAASNVEISAALQ